MKLPHLVLESKKVEFAIATAFVIRINPFYKNDKGLYAHEYEHVKQFYFAWVISSLVIAIIYWPAILAGFGVHGLLYKLVRKYRQKCEVIAFRKQIEVNGYGLEYCSKALSKFYNLNISIEQAKTLLSQVRL
jgi:hypothetical protein